MANSNSIIAYVSADLVTGTVNPSKVSCVQYDAELRIVAVRLRKNGENWYIPDGWEVNVRMKKADGTSVYSPQTYSGNVAYITLSAQMCNVWGTQTFVVEVVNGEQKVQTSPIKLDIKKNPIDDDTFISEDERDTIQQAVAQAQAAAESAQEAAQEAQETAQTMQETVQDIQDTIQAAQDAAQAAQEAADKLNESFEILSQEEYDELNPPNATTIYLVTDGVTAKMYYGSILINADTDVDVEEIISAQIEAHNASATAHENLNVDGNNT